MTQRATGVDTVMYPDYLPLEDAKEVVRIIKDGQLMEERSALAKHVWVLQGYAQGALLGDPDNIRIFAAAAPVPHDLDPVTVLELLVSQEEARRAGMAVPQALPAPLVFLLEWAIKKLVELLAAELGISI